MEKRKIEKEREERLKRRRYVREEEEQEELGGKSCWGVLIGWRKTEFTRLLWGGEEEE